MKDLVAMEFQPDKLATAKTLLRDTVDRIATDGFGQ
jgi:hypothetical protein